MSPVPGREDVSRKVYRKRPEIVSRKIADEVFLVPVRGKLADMQSIFTLNPVAEHIWNELDKKNVQDICDSVVSAFEVQKEQARTDILEFISTLLDADLIVEQK